jgi:hypothetical protein
MTMIEGPTSFVLFQDAAGDAEVSDPRPSSGPNPISTWYLRARERAERAAAKCATSHAARRVHQELAQSYARQLQMLRIRS